MLCFNMSGHFPNLFSLTISMVWGDTEYLHVPDLFISVVAAVLCVYLVSHNITAFSSSHVRMENLNVKCFSSHTTEELVCYGCLKNTANILHLCEVCSFVCCNEHRHGRA